VQAVKSRPGKKRQLGIFVADDDVDTVLTPATLRLLRPRL
jgi:hypothetical protein